MHRRENKKMNINSSLVCNCGGIKFYPCYLGKSHNKDWGGCRSEVDSSKDFYTLSWKWKWTAPAALENNLYLPCKIKYYRFFFTNIHIPRYIYSIPNRNTCWCAIGYMQNNVDSSNVRLAEKLETGHTSTGERMNKAGCVHTREF